MDFNKVFVYAFCCAGIMYLPIWSMMRAPGVNLAQFRGQDVQTNSKALVAQQLMLQARVNQALLRKISAEVVTPKEPLWTTQELIPMRASAGSGAFKATRLNLLRATLPLYLLPGQEKNPIWIQANQDIEQFRKRFGLPEVPLSDLEKTEQLIDKRCLKLIVQASSIEFSPEHEQRKVKITKKVKILLKQHGINSTTIPLYFIASEAEKKLNHGKFLAVTVGRSLIIFERILECSDQEITAILEHEIGHLVSHDSPYSYQLNVGAAKGEIDKKVVEDYILLVEKRADIHSGIQSKQNAHALCSTTAYSYLFQIKKILKELEQATPDFFITLMKTPEIIENLNKLDKKVQSESVTLKKCIQTIVTISSQEYLAHKMSANDLLEIIKICDQPTYLEDLLVYHAQQEKSERP